jgi:hypothetical protein
MTRTEAELRARIAELDVEIENDVWETEEWTWSDATTARAALAWALGEKEEI